MAAELNDTVRMGSSLLVVLKTRPAIRYGYGNTTAPIFAYAWDGQHYILVHLLANFSFDGWMIGWYMMTWLAWLVYERELERALGK